ncbi:MAG: hypothetical protein KL840_06270 [Aquamicrobium sp.]|nr:hypothetical protein [Aquamicrobium sp.]
MVASQLGNRGVFHPEEIEDMRLELSSGDIPDETPEEREARAQQIIARNMNATARAAIREKKPPVAPT